MYTETYSFACRASEKVTRFSEDDRCGTLLVQVTNAARLLDVRRKTKRSDIGNRGWSIYITIRFKVGSNAENEQSDACLDMKRSSAGW